MTTVNGTCLCGDVRFTMDGPFQMMMHCHCSRCRKHHGASFATFVGAPTSGFQFVAGADKVVNYASSPSYGRWFCPRCGSVCPSPEVHGDMHFVPAGNLVEDCGARPEMHIYAGSRAPFYEITDAVPQHEVLPPGWPDPGIRAEARPPATPGALSGSCLCNAVAFEITGAPLRMGHCHCSRCRRGRSAAHATNLFVTFDQFRWLRGESLVTVFDLPGAERFGTNFCAKCGSDVPRHSPKIGRVNVPAGCLDADPGIRPSFHIYVGSKAPWFEITDSIRQFEEAAI